MTQVAMVQLARQVAEALSEFADALERGPVAGTVEVAELPEGRGARQQKILALPGLADEPGMKTSEINDAIGYGDVPNTYNTLQALQRQGIVELVPGATPQRWRLTERYRGTASPILAVARLVREGEVTTYGDVSTVAFGHSGGARAVGRAAATIADFPNPHRLLVHGLGISPNWTSHDGLGPDECERRLRREGVEFGDGGTVLPAYHVPAEELARRHRETIEHGVHVERG